MRASSASGNGAPAFAGATRLAAGATRLAAGATLLFAAGGALCEEPAPTPRDPAREVEQRRPGPSEPQRYVPPPPDPSQVPPPLPAAPRETLPVPDRWRIMRGLGMGSPWFDPYNQNLLKGDLPVVRDWFVNLGVVSDTLAEFRALPIPVGAQTTQGPDGLDTFGRGRQSTLAQTFIVSVAAIKGDTTFKPPDYEVRLVPAFSFNRSEVEELRALRIDPRAGTTRDDNHVGLQEAFVDVHLRNVSDRYDFDSIRAGIQPFISDFRGFLFNDVPFGVRLFGTRDNNRWQYNLGWFRRMEKDTNSGLNDVGTSPRRDDTFVANAYRQDWPVLGFTSQGIVAVNVNREGDERFYDANGFLVRPAVQGDGRGHDYSVAYVGYSGDGHIGRWNLTATAYLALGRDDRHPIAQREQTIRAGFAAAELSCDFSWLRVRVNALLQSGDSDPFDDRATGFDAILENPQFAGADTSFWIRQAVPLVGGGGVALSGRNGVLASLRSSKDQGQSNFVNPGLLLLGAGVDADVAPQVRVVGNVSYLRFAETEVLGVLRNQSPPSRDLGLDVSAAIQWRPFMTQNVVLNASAAALVPGKGLKQLYDQNKPGTLYSVLVNLLATF